MRGRRKAIAVVAGALVVAVVAGVASAAGTGLLTISMGSGKHVAATGIQVHGKWSLVVHAKDGHVVASRRFENSLTTNGAKMLVGMIDPAGGVSLVSGLVGGVEVVLDDGSSTGHGCQIIYLYNSCALSRAWTRGSDANGPGSGTLKVAVSGTTLTLSGNVAPLVAVTISKVETELKQCDPWLGYDSEDCANQQVDNSDAASAGDTQWYQFTSKNLDSPLSVTAGQSIAVSVQISFS